MFSRSAQHFWAVSGAKSGTVERGLSGTARHQHGDFQACRGFEENARRAHDRFAVRHGRRQPFLNIDDDQRRIGVTGEFCPRYYRFIVKRGGWSGPYRRARLLISRWNSTRVSRWPQGTLWGAGTFDDLHARVPVRRTTMKPRWFAGSGGRSGAARMRDLGREVKGVHAAAAQALVRIASEPDTILSVQSWSREAAC
jgi:hypothetical protein